MAFLAKCGVRATTRILNAKSPVTLQAAVSPITTETSRDHPFQQDHPVRQVFISQSNDIFSNLALEDWLYKNHDFQHKVILA